MDCKEIQPVISEEDQPWDFFGRNDAKAETPILQSTLCIRWPKYWRFSFSISPSNEYSGQISFRIDWFDLLAVQGTLKSLLQHHSSRALILEQTRIPREFDYGGQWDLITELPQDWGNRLLEGTDQTLCTPGARRKEQ